MAGKRPSKNSFVTSAFPLKENDAFFITNKEEDRNLSVLDLQKMLRDGSGLEGDDAASLTFATNEMFNTLLRPLNSNFRILINWSTGAGIIQFYNNKTGRYQTPLFTADQNGNATWTWDKEGSE